jgi:anti-sigma regulatory factor (Ser/Thr protein kinase)
MAMLAESQINIEPNAVAVRELGPWLRDATAPLSPEVADVLLARAELAVHEACMNVIDHANLPIASSLELELELSDDCLVVRLTDLGDPFDLARVPTPDPHILKPRGYGVKIIRALATELSYRRVGETNELTLRFDIGKNHD